MFDIEKLKIYLNNNALKKFKNLDNFIFDSVIFFILNLFIKNIAFNFIENSFFTTILVLLLYIIFYIVMIALYGRETTFSIEKNKSKYIDYPCINKDILKTIFSKYCFKFSFFLLGEAISYIINILFFDSVLFIFSFIYIGLILFVFEYVSIQKNEYIIVSRKQKINIVLYNEVIDISCKDISSFNIMNDGNIFLDCKNQEKIIEKNNIKFIQIGAIKLKPQGNKFIIMD